MASDRRQNAAIVIAERKTGVSAQVTQDIRCRRLPFLLGSRAETRHRCPIRIGERCHIADDKDFTVSG